MSAHPEGRGRGDGRRVVRAAIAAAAPARARTTTDDAPPAATTEVHGFEMRRAGLFRLSADKTKADLHVSGPFEVLAATRDGDNDGWGLLLRWRDADQVPHEWIMPFALLAGDAGEVRARLAAGGLYLSPHPQARQALLDFLWHQRPHARVRTVPRVGWHFGRAGGAAFVLPGGRIFGDVPGERVLLDLPGPPPATFRAAGTAEGWRRAVAARCVGNRRLLFAVSLAFAPLLLTPLGEESGGVNLRGESRRGKSTALRAAASVWGAPEGHSSFVRQWRATGNSIEGTAAEHNDCLLPLDELGQVDPREAGEIVYMLGNNQGKGRAHREGRSRPAATWRVLILSTGEKGLAETLAEAGRPLKAGQEVRFVDLPADAGKGLGLFEELHGAPDAATFAEELRAAMAREHGTAGPAFLAWLAPKIAADPGWPRAALEPRVRDFLGDFLPSGADAQVRSVGRRFALAAVAGELATEAGVTGWPLRDAWAAAGECFLAWLEDRGAPVAREELAAVAQLRGFIQRHGAARFERWPERTSVPPEGDGEPEATLPAPTSPPNEPRLVMQRAGWRRWIPDPEAPGGGTWRYYLTADAWREALQGLDRRAAAKALHAHGHLLSVTPDGKYSRKYDVPTVGSVRLYEISASILATEQGAD